MPRQSLRHRATAYRIGAAFTVILLSAAWTVPARADDPTTVEMTLKDHKFTPSEIHVKSGQRTVINLHNQDSTAEEFDSDALGVEKVVGGGKSGTVRLRALDPGKYPFMGEYHSDTAQGIVIVE
jgi:plastocyanin